MSQNVSHKKIQRLAGLFAQVIIFGLTASFALAQTNTTPIKKPLDPEDMSVEQITNLQNQNQNLTKSNAELQQDLKEKELRITQIHQINLKIYKEIKAAEELISKLEQRIVQYQIDNTNLEFEKDKLELQLFNSQTLTKHHRKEADYYKNEIATIKNDFDVREQTHENLFTSLQDSLNSDKIKIADLTDRIVVRLEDNLLFDSGWAFIKSTGFSTLNKIGNALKELNNKHIQVEGHTDNLLIKGNLKTKYPTNWELSSARATAVARYLVNVIKIKPNRISSAGFGSHQPIADNSKQSGRELNRRVEFALFPLR